MKIVSGKTFRAVTLPSVALRIVALPLVALLGFALLLLLLGGGVVNADVSLPNLPRGKGTSCVAPTEMMRKNHMDYLLHQRDLTVRNGVRTERYSLVGCVQCHVQKNDHGNFIAVDAPGQFCQSCHDFASVKLDCFECHATKPDANTEHMSEHIPAHMPAQPTAGSEQ